MPPELADKIDFTCVLQMVKKKNPIISLMDKISGAFPLFSHLRNEIHEEDSHSPQELTTSKKVELSERIKELDEQGCSLVYALIRYYQIYEMKMDPIEAPFGMKKIKQGYRFCIEEIPSMLQHLLIRFIDIHLQQQSSSSSPPATR